ncbi:Asp/Glu/hydantoin racemase [Moelleriella libera RCEF 2490]|uniref:Asp/Glu/hydantoin racemase n=1 Tax=Moelleriella libera RCEF 2490 TaxID=1081109 RepID=A0A167WRR4_9HYPO|nr:Asp/Glu/hydantoin racemase [Moelleriella libera RCEF 2490]
MTEGMLVAARSIALSYAADVGSMTATSAPSSINDSDDIDASTKDVVSMLEDTPALFHNWDAILLACYSVHTLVPVLSSALQIPVMGIFEASILASLSLVNSTGKWGIVTTGSFWEKHLSDGVHQFLGTDPTSSNLKFAGVFSSGLSAGDFHTKTQTEVDQKLTAATRELLNTGNVICVVMGCGGMAGLEDVIRATAREVYGKTKAENLYIVDGIKAGVMQLHQAYNCGKLFR